MLGRIAETLSYNTFSEPATYSTRANGNRIGGYNQQCSSFANVIVDNQDRLLTVDCGVSTRNYSYSTNGELSSKTTGTSTTTYDYDAVENLRSVTLPDLSFIEYIVDGKGRRVGKKVNGQLTQGFLYDGQLRVVAELDGSGTVVSRFVYGEKANVPQYQIRGGVTYRLISDHLGSPRLVVNSADGTVVQRIDYDEFGHVTTDTNPGFQPFGFAGGFYDRDTKLVRFGARDYDAETGRWTAKDPIRFGGGNPNLYGYVVNDPVDFSDASGLVTGGVGIISTTSVGANAVTTVNQVVIDTSGHIGIATTVCYGGSTEPLGTTSAVIGSIGNAPTISDLSGPSVDIGIGVAPPLLGGVSGGGSLTSGTSSSGGRTLTGNACLGGSVGLSPVDISGQGCTTTVVPLF